MKASPQVQLKLLELAGLDAELGRLDHRRRALPEAQEYGQIEATDAGLRDELAIVDAQRSDMDTELLKAERDVDQVRTRIERDRARLDGGQVSNAKELESLQSEIGSLQRRQGALEEVVLEVMERQEEAGRRHQGITTEREGLASQKQEVGERRDAALADIAKQAMSAGESRTAIAGQIPDDLLTLYDRLRAQHGVGAAALSRGRCEGCHLSLNTVDLGRIRAADPDEVLRCEECRRILVRTPESGL